MLASLLLVFFALVLPDGSGLPLLAKMGQQEGCKETKKIEYQSRVWMKTR